MPKQVSGQAGYASTDTRSSTEDDYLDDDVVLLQELNDKKIDSKTGIPEDAHEVRVKALVEMYEQFAKNINTKPEEGIGSNGKKTKPTIPSTKAVSRLSADIPNATWFDSDDAVKFRLNFLESKVTSAVTFFNDLIAIKISNARNNFIYAMELEKRLKEQKAKAKQRDKVLMRIYSKLTRLEIAVLKLNRECRKLLEKVAKLEKFSQSKANGHEKKVDKMIDTVSLLSSLVEECWIKLEVLGTCCRLFKRIRDQECQDSASIKPRIDNENKMKEQDLK